MSPLRFLVDAFVNTFGITRPKREDEVRSGRIIAIMLVGVAVLIGGVAWLLQAAFSHR